MRQHPATDQSTRNELMKEVWRPVPGYETSYEVSNYGQIKSLHRIVGHPHTQTGTCLRQAQLMKLSKGRYLGISLCRDGVEKNFLVHRLVAMVFVKGDHSLTVDHINGDKHDNRASNLRWISRSENASIARACQEMAKGPDSAKAKLTTEQVQNIRKDTRTCKAIGDAYGVSAATVSMIKRRLRYSNVT